MEYTQPATASLTETMSADKKSESKDSSGSGLRPSSAEEQALWEETMSALTQQAMPLLMIRTPPESYAVFHASANLDENRIGTLFEFRGPLGEADIQKWMNENPGNEEQIEKAKETKGSAVILGEIKTGNNPKCIVGAIVVYAIAQRFGDLAANGSLDILNVTGQSLSGQSGSDKPQTPQ